MADVELVKLKEKTSYRFPTDKDVEICSPIKDTYTEDTISNIRSGNYKVATSYYKSYLNGEKAFNMVTLLAGVLIVLLLAGILISLFLGAIPSINYNGLKFLIQNVWDPVFKKYGALPFFAGTLLTSFFALSISIPFSLAVSLVLGEYMNEGLISSLLKSTTDLLAGVPSVIYGFWGFFFITPIIRKVEVIFNFPPFGVSILSASIILAIMIIPYSASIAREVITLVPLDLKEAAYSLGATKYETVNKVIIKYSMSGILAGIVLSLGRAIGETMAVTMLIGNSNFLPKNIFFSPANTIASVIANEFTEATDSIYLSSLIEIGLLLFAVSFVLNIFGKYLIKKFVVE